MAKKISAIVSLVIIGILILTTIIMASVKVNYGIRCEKPSNIYVQFKQSTAEKVDLETQVDDIVKLINNQSKMNSLSALFQGKLNKQATVVAESSTGSTLPNTEGYYVRYVYSSAQDLKQGNKIYKDGDGKTYKYYELVFEVLDMVEEGEVKVYVITNSNTPNVYSHYYTLDANFGELFKYLSQHNFND